ncbi:MAG: FAD binding domain-containing protein [Verrucomicrobia bacterium]|nr:FAD binding domain-containing protein [Verrucomicrobiota bacterium]
MFQFLLNREVVSADLPHGTVLLDFIRRRRGLAGTKEGCREGDCGACMVLLGEPLENGLAYRPVNSCLVPLAEAEGRHVVTIEGLNRDALTPVQQAFVDEGAAQCGFCTPGFMLSLAGFLLSSPRWDGDAANEAIGGNLCRCTGYIAIRRALAKVCARLSNEIAAPAGSAERVRQLVAGGWLPDDFLSAAGIVNGLQCGGTQIALGHVPPVLVAGGTDLFVQRGDELESAPMDLLSRRAHLRGIRMENGVCVIGAATPLADLEDSEALRAVLPGLERHLRLVASRPIRNRATLAGNLVNASPIGDLAILLLALDARLTLGDEAGRRVVQLRDFFLGYKVIDRRPDELVLEIEFDPPPPDAVLGFEKVSRRTHLDIAAVNSAMLAVARDGRISTMRLSVGGVAPVPKFLQQTCAMLTGAEITPAVLRGALDAADDEIAPISDVRGSADYKRNLLRRLLVAHFQKLSPEAAEELLP